MRRLGRRVRASSRDGMMYVVRGCARRESFACSSLSSPRAKREVQVEGRLVIGTSAMITNDTSTGLSQQTANACVCHGGCHCRLWFGKDRLCDDYRNQKRGDFTWTISSGSFFDCGHGVATPWMQYSYSGEKENQTLVPSFLFIVHVGGNLVGGLIIRLDRNGMNAPGPKIL